MLSRSLQEAGLNVMPPDYSMLSYQELDDLAWKVIREWPVYADINIWQDGLNYHELTAWFLWDKARLAVMRASQKKIFDAENLRFHKTESIITAPPTETRDERVFSRICKYLGKRRASPNVSCDAAFQRTGRKLMYAPIISERLESTIRNLLYEGLCQVVSKHAPRTPVNNLDFLGAHFKCAPDHEFAEYIFGGISKGFSQFGFPLPAAAQNTLKAQLVDLTVTVGVVVQELECLRPDAILVHGDNHPPHQVYVAVARKMNLPSIMLQHGLDCERNYLDEAYASAIAVWGRVRERRYSEKSSWKPEIRVTGNPEFDTLSLPSAIESSGTTWLWLTRPHAPEKCYAPSRNPFEGLSILHALLQALGQNPDATLLIKAHPYDYKDEYLNIIQQSEHAKRVSIAHEDVHDLLAQASLVVTEDSTAGMEAMFWGRPLVHAHFSPSDPVMPFVEYGAALPGFNADQLIESVAVLHKMAEDELQQFYSGQLRFLADFAGPCDGKAAERVAAFVVDLIK